MDAPQPSRLPPEIISVIDASSLCYLATVSASRPGPHLSAMNFTLQADPVLGDVLVMTTRRDTLKFEGIALNSNVAVLIHDFDGRRHSPDDFSVSLPAPQQVSPPHTGTLAVTIYGRAVVQEGDVASRSEI